MKNTFLKGKNVLVTGATGLIGSNLTHRLQSAGANVSVMGRNYDKLSKCFPQHVQNHLHLIEHDISMPYAPCADFDYIFHAAGPMERSGIMNRPVDVIKPNILGLFNILEAMRLASHHQKLIVFSSVTVYGNDSAVDKVFDESMTSACIPLDNPYACYAESKRMVEVIAKSYVKQYGLDVVIARLSTVYGNARIMPDTAIFEFLSKSLEGKAITLNNNDFPHRDNIYIDDALEALLLLLEKGINGQSYNVSSNGELENVRAVDEIAREIAAASAQISGNEQVIVSAPSLSNRKGGVILDNSKLKSLGWQIQTSFKEGINKLIRNRLNG